MAMGWHTMPSKPLCIDMTSLKCIDCGKILSSIDWKKTGLIPTKEVRCNTCGLRQFDL